jgi:4'-phosphopantetheinyl transferase
VREDEIHLWLASLDEPIDEPLRLCYESLLDDSESARYRRFHFLRDRENFLVSRALVRTVLSKYTQVPPTDWRFEADGHGKPSIGCPRVSEPIAFNLSHTRRMAVLAIAAGHAIGVDIENFRDRQAPLDVAASYFSAEEAGALGELPEGERGLRFFEYWTFKESYVKARGVGLSHPLDRAGFRFPSDDTVEFFEGSCEAGAEPRWQFWQLRPTAEHLIALCVELLRSRPSRIVVRQVIPLRDEWHVAANISRFQVVRPIEPAA